MFFELHDEKRIGYKLLSDADLGRGESSHQTHIGLSEYVLSFLPNRDSVNEDSIFIYNNTFEYIDAYFDRIENPDGTFRSPKIRIGDRGCISIVSTIRNTVQTDGPNKRWFLFWFGLKNEKVVYFLFDDESVDYEHISNLGIDLNKKGARTVNESDGAFLQLTKYIETKINANGLEILKELEVSTQTKAITPDKRFKSYDIMKANEIIVKLGKKGEELIDKYLSEQVRTGKITSYHWTNRDYESGLPYDFSIQDNYGDVSYLDVKTTGYDFNQRMVFSSQEIEFIARSDNKYNIYRVYKGIDGFYLRICNDCKELSVKIFDKVKSHKKDLTDIDVGFMSSKLAITPNILISKFGSEIVISDS